MVWLDGRELGDADNWRAEYHVSPAGLLVRLGKTWPSLGSRGPEILDGWRFSENPRSAWYRANVLLQEDDGIVPERCGGVSPAGVDQARWKRAVELKQTIDQKRYYRMRHVGVMRLVPEQEQFESPLIAKKPYCLCPGDVLIRRVGQVVAGPVADHHRRHPVDANVGIVRGLHPMEGVWLAFCLNQPVYQDYLVQSAGITTLPRVGLKRLGTMPLAPRPEGFDEPARIYLNGLDELAQAEERLFQLRRRVREWMDRATEGIAETDGSRRIRTRFFAAQDMDEALTYAGAMQNRVQRLTLDQGGQRLDQLAEVCPRFPKENAAGSKVLKIAHLDDQFGYALNLHNEQNVRWRVQPRAVHRYDVLVSSFVQDPRVMYAHSPLPNKIFPTDQLVSFRFHFFPGAYALLLETPFATRQMARLATGMAQRFVRPSALSGLVLPFLDREHAGLWHARLNEILDRRQQAMAVMDQARERMEDLFHDVHPRFAGAHMASRRMG